MSVVSEKRIRMRKKYEKIKEIPAYISDAETIAETRQSKVKESKGKESKVNNIYVPLEKQIEPFQNQYAPSMIIDFILHYTQQSPNGKELWQVIRSKGAFDVGKRLATWKRRGEKHDQIAAQKFQKVEETPQRKVEDRVEGRLGSLKDLLPKI